MPEVITNNLDLWTSALHTRSTAGRGSNSKLEAYGIKKLRELIYELAAKGLLVDAAGDAAAKTAKIGDVADLVMGQAPPGNECNKDGVGTIFVKTGEFGELYPEVVEWTTKPLKLAKAGDVLICVVGATVGKLNLAIDCAIGRSVAAIRPCRDIDTKYLYFSLMPYTLKLRSQSRGSAQGVIGKEELNAVEIRLPSLKEQHRIVAKVDELMALCEQLEQQQTHSIEAHQTLVATLLGALTRVASQQEFSEAWARISSHFDALFTTEASIDQLKQTILQLAVMGKLVPQDKNEESASVLLEEISEQKERLVDAGEIRKQKPLLNIDEEEKQFELPVGWKWCRLHEIVYLLGDGLHGTPEYTLNEKYYFVNGNNLNDGQIVIKSETKTVAQDQYNKYKKPLGENSVLVSINGTLGNVAFYNNEAVILGKSACFFNLADGIYKRFIKLVIDAPSFADYSNKYATGSTIKNLGLSAMNSLPIALPPKEEQHRIVAKVDELIELCDTLKARLADAQAIQLHLADAIVEQAVC